MSSSFFPSAHEKCFTIHLIVLTLGSTISFKYNLKATIVLIKYLSFIKINTHFSHKLNFPSS